MNNINKIKILQNEIEKHVNSLSRELGLNEEMVVMALELTTSKIRAMASMRDAYKEYEEEEKLRKQQEFAKNMQSEIENTLKEETE